LHRRVVLLAIGAGVVAAWVALSMRGGRRPERIILISVDSLRSDFLGVYNPRAACSPRIDAFARDSLVFADAITQAPSTAPSHKSILYSLYPSVHKVDHRAQTAERVTSPIEVLRREGYLTAAFTGGGQLRKRFGFDRGFDSYWEPERGVERTEKLHEMKPLVLRWLEEHKQRRFFLFLHTYQVHCPYEPPAELFRECCAWYSGPIDPAGKCTNFYNNTSMSPEDYRFLRDLYCAELRFADAFFGDLLDRLRALGIYDNTLIALFSDHGESLGERGYVGHNQLHQEQLRIPLIVRVPGLAGRRVDSPVEAIDLMPTLFDVAGIAAPYPFQGTKLLSTLGQARPEVQPRVRITETREAVALQSGHWKGIFPLGRMEAASLYHLAQDPEERADLAAANAEVLKRLWASYAGMQRDSRELSARFVRETGPPAAPDEALKQELKALGYVN
jgi:arylsulfatase A-like enzyme